MYGYPPQRLNNPALTLKQAGVMGGNVI